MSIGHAVVALEYRRVCLLQSSYSAGGALTVCSGSFAAYQRSQTRLGSLTVSSRPGLATRA